MILGKIIYNEEKATNNQDFVYEELISEIETKKTDNDFDLLGNVDSNNEAKKNLKDTISNLNTKLEENEINERWSFSCSSEFETNEASSCDSYSSTSTIKCMNPLKCNTIDSNNELKNRYESVNPEINDLINIINKIIIAIKFIDNTSENNSIKNKADVVKAAYKTFLIDAKTALGGYTTKLKPVTVISDIFVGNGSILGFLNCAFLGKNLKVLLYYLDDSVGRQFKNLGIIILVTGFGMALSISFTIILVIIFNATVQIREEALRKPNLINEPEAQIQNNPVGVNNTGNNLGEEFKEK